MSEENLLSAADVARLAGVGRAAVSNWRRRYPDFPEPAPSAGTAPAFRRDEIDGWLREQGKLDGKSDLKVLWRALDAQRGALPTIDAAAQIAEYLAAPDAVNIPDDALREALDGITGDRSKLVEQLCTQLFERQQRQHLMTPPELADLMAELAAPGNGTVFDPACGPANTLLAAARHAAGRLIGQELDPALARLAQARLVLHAPAEVTAGDALRGDAYAELRADAVLCDPPFGLRDWGHDELGIDPRWEYGFPAKGEPELAWAQHCLAHTKPGGAVVIAMPAGVASRRSGRAIRQALLRRGAVRAVLALPPGVLRSTGIPIHLWVLRNPEDDPGPVLLVDAGEHEPSRRGNVDWQAIHEAVLHPWRPFAEDGDVATVAGRHRVVEPIELLDEDVDLTPARHLPHPAEQVDVGELNDTVRRLSDSLAQVGTLLPQVREGHGDGAGTATIGDLARAGALTLRQQARGLDVGDEHGSGPLVLTGRDVAEGAEPALRLAAPAGEDAVWLRPGDLVVPLVARGSGHRMARVVERDDLVLGPNLHLVRVDEQQLDVQFLAGRLRSGQATRASSSTLSGVHKLDIRRVEVPILDLRRQREIGEAFRRVAAFQGSIAELTGSAADVATRLTDALAAGAAEPDG